FVESLRSIRTNVLYSFTGESLKTIVVTSATIGEGKTVLASNLAVAIAQAGDRVLLVDADMRRPTLHHMFSLNREPGLSNLLFGVGAERVTRQVAIRALEQLKNLDARIVGGVLARVDLKRNAYYYSKYYHPRYDEYANPASSRA